MRFILTTLCFLSFYSISQVKIKDTLFSKALNLSREIIIQTPEFLDSTKKYPLIIALDGDYLNYSLNGEVSLYSYFEKIPECITVSIPQNYKDTAANKFRRWVDCDYDWKNGLPEKQGITFQKFILTELVPYLEKNYPIAPYKVIIGHSFTANFINYFLLDETKTFSGFGAISPYYADNSFDTIINTLSSLTRPIRYFVSVGEKDLSGHKKSVNLFTKQVDKLDNKNLDYKRYATKNNEATHYTIVSKSMPYLIEHLFLPYTAISEDQFKILLKEKDKYAFLLNKYEQIKVLFGIDLKIRKADFDAVGYAMYKKGDWEDIFKLGELQLQLYPESYDGYFTLGGYFEHKKEYEKALDYYQKGYNRLGEEVSNKQDFMQDIDRVKKKLK